MRFCWAENRNTPVALRRPDDGPRSDGVVVIVDLLRCNHQDPGLVSRCVVP